MGSIVEDGEAEDWQTELIRPPTAYSILSQVTCSAAVSEQDGERVYTWTGFPQAKHGMR